MQPAAVALPAADAQSRRKRCGGSKPSEEHVDHFREVGRAEKSLKKKIEHFSTAWQFDDELAAYAGSAAVTLAIKRQAIQTARRNFEQQVATTTVVCEPMDCVLASILRKARPNKEAQNDRLVARSLRAVHHPLMWPALRDRHGDVLAGEREPHLPMVRTQPGLQHDGVQLDRVHVWLYVRVVAQRLHSGVRRVALVAAAICCVPLVLWTLTANVPLIKATGLRPETVFVIANVLRWAVCVNFTLDPSCRFFTVLAPFPEVWVLFL